MTKTNSDALEQNISFVTKKNTNLDRVKPKWSKEDITSFQNQFLIYLRL